MRSPSLHQAPMDRLASGVRRTFGIELGWPRLSRRFVIAIAIAAALATGAAAAAWQVHDRETYRQVHEIRDRIGGSSSTTVVGELQKVNTRLRLDHKPSAEAAGLVAEPGGTAKLDRDVPSAAALTIGRLCPSGVSSGLGQRQRTLCREMVQTELAQYAFAMRMFERAAEHHARLEAIEKRRRALGPEDYADLQANSNELLALTALMDNDRDRYQTYMRAYEARVAHIRTTQIALSRNLFKGRGGVDLPASL
ncbi:hypothetical protein [Luteimonas sp. 3794]|uniref:hypothetical protein n=1 Tax=Luteimonas sp. 3794 TaxID=2817730 RepID=UPI0028571498|nr:hypothetical protein [Luteimonas sp. 3794]MDR6991638.1 hypothetical protein [Luteimonas sp. 3794]